MTQLPARCHRHSELRINPRANNAARTIISTPRLRRNTPPRLTSDLINRDIDYPTRCVRLSDPLQIPDNAATPMTFTGHQYSIPIFQTRCCQEHLNSRLLLFRPHRLSTPLRLYGHYAAPAILHARKPFEYDSPHKNLVSKLILLSLSCFPSLLSIPLLTIVCGIDIFISPATV